MKKNYFNSILGQIMLWYALVYGGPFWIIQYRCAQGKHHTLYSGQEGKILNFY